METRPRRVCLVGSGTRFVSGISYYTIYLGQELSRRYQLSVILMRRLIPRLFYPGRKRVGAPITDLHTSRFAPTFDGVDWYGVPSVPRAIAFLRRQRPEAIILQFWTGSSLPWYALISAWARRQGVPVVLEVHEDVDTGEAGLPVIGTVAQRAFRRLVRSAAGVVVHSDWDRQRLVERWALEPGRVAVIPHGPFPMAAELTSGELTSGKLTSGEPASDGSRPRPDAAGRSEITILFFGTIRPYKGLEHLVAAFSALPREGDRRWKLLVVGETWEGWTGPIEEIAASPFSQDIELINRYVPDEEVPGLFARADVVALPYLRSSASGPLHLTMSAGLPVVVTSVGGLTEAAEGYSGAVMVPPADPAALAEGIVAAGRLAGRAHADPRGWTDIGDLYEAVLAPLLDGAIPR